MEAERALVALGAKTPRCLWLLEDWRGGSFRYLPTALREISRQAELVARDRWYRCVPRPDPPTRVRTLLIRECRDLFTQSLRTVGYESAKGQFRVRFSSECRWPALWNGLITDSSVSLSLTLRLDWYERVHQTGLGLIDGHFVVDVVRDDLVLALRWQEWRRPGWREPVITLARVSDGGARLSWLAFTLRETFYKEVDGQRIRGAGFDVLDDRKVVKVAGVSFRSDALQSPTVAPLQRLSLVPEPSNREDPCAVAVWDAGRSVHVGYVPRDEAGPLSAALKRGEAWCAVSLWEWWQDDGFRVGLRVMLVPPGQNGPSSKSESWVSAGGASDGGREPSSAAAIVSSSRPR